MADVSEDTKLQILTRTEPMTTKTSMLIMTVFDVIEGGDGIDADFDEDGVNEFADLDTNNDGMIDSETRDMSTPITTVWQISLRVQGSLTVTSLKT